MEFSYATRLKCVKCSAEYPLEYILVCKKCSNLVEFDYDLAEVAKIDFGSISEQGIWKFHPVLPIKSREHTVTMGEGSTPLLECSRYGKTLGLQNLRVKYEGSNPTGTFKDRSSASAIAAARQFGFTRTAVVSTGNAGASIAAYASRGGIKSTVFCYSKAAPAKLYHMEACATQLIVYEGGYDEIAVQVGKHLEKLKIFDSDARRNPYKHEGKKTLSYELFFQLGRKAPDFLLVPVSLGEMMVATWRGFREMKEMGWIDKMPRLIACQSHAANPVVRAVDEKKSLVPQQVGYTIAEGVAVGNPGLKGERALEAVRATDGFAASVEDEEIVEAMASLARTEGIWSGPTGAVTIAALEQLVKANRIDPAASIVAIVSETGLKGDFPPFPAEAQALDPDKIVRILEAV